LLLARKLFSFTILLYFDGSLDHTTPSGCFLHVVVHFKGSHSQPFVFCVISFEPFSLIKMTFQRHAMGNQYLKLTKKYGNIIHIEIDAQPQTNLTPKKSLKKNSIL
jgi:hypothetical protein